MSETLWPDRPITESVSKWFQIISKIASTPRKKGRLFLTVVAGVQNPGPERLTSPAHIRVGGERVVDGANDLVHALDVALAGVQLGVEEEDALDDLPVRLLTARQSHVVVLLLAPLRVHLLCTAAGEQQECQNLAGWQTREESGAGWGWGWGGGQIHPFYENSSGTMRPRKK